VTLSGGLPFPNDAPSDTSDRDSFEVIISKPGAADRLETSCRVQMEGEAAARSSAKMLGKGERVRLDRVRTNGDMEIPLIPRADVTGTDRRHHGRRPLTSNGRSVLRAARRRPESWAWHLRGTVEAVLLTAQTDWRESRGPRGPRPRPRDEGGVWRAPPRRRWGRRSAGDRGFGSASGGPRGDGRDVDAP
jgi:hypothetical protein